MKNGSREKPDIPSVLPILKLKSSISFKIDPIHSDHCWL